MNEDEDHVLDGQVISVVEPPTPFTLSGQVVGVTFGRPEEPGKPGRITIEVTSSSEHMPLLAPGDVVDLHRIATPKKERKSP